MTSLQFPDFGEMFEIIFQHSRGNNRQAEAVFDRAKNVTVVNMATTSGLQTMFGPKISQI